MRSRCSAVGVYFSVKPVLAGSILLGLVACGGSQGAADASTQPGSDSSSPHVDGGRDGQATHDGGRDAVVSTPDGGLDVTTPSDAHGASKDADATSAHDAAQDVAIPDGGLLPAVACTDTPGQVYANVPGLPAFTNAMRGDITACTNDGTIDTATVESQMNGVSDVGVTAVTGVSIYRVQYRTTRANGTPAVSSARIYLPLVPISAQPPIIVAAHGTEGLAATCTTSMDSTSMRDLALPWAGLGYPVITPDYAGLGTEGVQGYTDNRDTARSVVDSVSALRKFVTTTLARQVVIDGHSQGGGAALATQALATSMDLDGTLAAVVTFAPEYYSHLDSLGFLDALESVQETNPTTISTGVTKCEVAMLMEYQYFANYVMTGPATAGFPAAKASELGTAIEGQCTVQLGGTIQAEAFHIADWTDPTFRGDLLACVHASGAWDGGYERDAGADAASDAGPASCTGVGQAFFKYLQQNILTPDALGAPILLVQGLEDIVMPADQEAACNVIALEAGGVTPQVCTDATASHTNVVNRNIGYGIQWAQSVLAGTTRPPCAASNLPACSQP